jgi:hypothetical protein
MFILAGAALLTVAFILGVTSWQLDSGLLKAWCLSFVIPGGLLAAQGDLLGRDWVVAAANLAAVIWAARIAHRDRTARIASAGSRREPGLQFHHGTHCQGHAPGDGDLAACPDA